MSGRFKLFVVLIACAFVVACRAGKTVPQLPALTIATSEISVSGLSSGGFMAVQVHVAHSATFKRGAGIVAGGPYYCSEGSLADAVGRCMEHNREIPVQKLVQITNEWADGKLIDPVVNLKTSRCYLFSGTADKTVKPAVMNELKSYYQSFMPGESIFYKSDIPAGHAMITDDFGGPCSTTAAPFINDCDFDLAGAILAHLYGPLNPRNNGDLSGILTEFDQTAFVSGHGMAQKGWVYIPRACAAGAVCKLHVVFHGCRQNAATVAQRFVRHTGYNRWADTNDIVVLYPQTGDLAPKGCWDWWGYDSENFANKSGPQIAAVKAMVTRLSGGAVAPSKSSPFTGNRD